MGEAVDIVKGGKNGSGLVPRSKTFGQGSVIHDLTNIVDRIDRAKEAKQSDLDNEGRSALAENHAKLGLLQAAGALVRRARALLEDYGKDIDEDIAAELNEGLGDDLKHKFTPDDPKTEKRDLQAKDFAGPEDDDAPFGPEDLPAWMKIGVKLRDPDDDGPWTVTDIDYDLGHILIDDQRINPDGTPFSGGTPLDFITFDDLAPEGEWCPYDCGHTTTNADGSCADCGVKDVSIPILPEIGSKWLDGQDREWAVDAVVGEGNKAKVKLKTVQLPELTQVVPIRELVEDFEKKPKEEDDATPTG